MVDFKKALKAVKSLSAKKKVVKKSKTKTAKKKTGVKSAPKSPKKATRKTTSATTEIPTETEVGLDGHDELEEMLHPDEELSEDDLLSLDEDSTPEPEEE